MWPPSCRTPGVTCQQRLDGLQQQQDEVVAFVLKRKDRINDLLLIFA